MDNVRMEYAEGRGKWEIYVGAEWYFEGNFDEAERVYQSFMGGNDEEEDCHE